MARGLSRSPGVIRLYRFYLSLSAVFLAANVSGEENHVQETRNLIKWRTPVYSNNLLFNFCYANALRIDFTEGNIIPFQSQPKTIGRLDEPLFIRDT